MSDGFQQWIRDRFEEWLAREGGERRGAIQRFAKKIGRQPSTISQWLRGAATPDDYGCMLLAEGLGLPVEEARQAAGKLARLAEETGPYDTAGDDLADEFRHALGPDYTFIASLEAKERQRLILAWAAMMHHHLELHRRIRELESRPTS